MVIACSDAAGFVDSDTAKKAVTDSIAAVTGVPSDYIDIDISIQEQGRRLQTRKLSSLQSGNLIITYVITVPGDAPETVNATGFDVGEQLNAAKMDTIEQVIVANVADS